MGIPLLFTICFIAITATSNSITRDLDCNYSLKYESIYSFGDSLADTGNYLLSIAPTIPSTGKLPYGETFFGKPTGRCFDGRLIIDFIAEACGLPYVAPYLGLSNDTNTHGVNFAVTGATALDAKFFYDKGIGPIIVTNDSLSVQLGWFKQLKSTLCTTKPDCDSYFKKSLFLMGEIGVNDYNYLFLFTGATTEQLKPNVPLVIDAIAVATSVLIEEGAVKLVVPGNFSIGCSAVYLTLFQTTNKEAYDKYGCLREYNDFAVYHNDMLQLALQNLRQKYPQARIIYGDYYGTSKRIIEAPLRYGFTNGVSRSCYGGGGPYNFNVLARCGELGSKSCDSPSTYANWDGIHLTEAAYRYIAMGLINDSFTSTK